jgi:hypothetical protein
LAICWKLYKKESPSAVSVAGKIFYFNFAHKDDYIFIWLKRKQSADNSLAFLKKKDSTEVVFSPPHPSGGWRGSSSISKSEGQVRNYSGQGIHQ